MIHPSCSIALSLLLSSSDLTRDDRERKEISSFCSDAVKPKQARLCNLRWLVRWRRVARHLSGEVRGRVRVCVNSASDPAVCPLFFSTQCERETKPKEYEEAWQQVTVGNSFWPIHCTAVIRSWSFSVFKHTAHTYSFSTRARLKQTCSCSPFCFYSFHVAC